MAATPHAGEPDSGQTPGQTPVAGWVTGIGPSEKECGRNPFQQVMRTPERERPGLQSQLSHLPAPGMRAASPLASRCPRVVKCQPRWTSPRRLTGGPDAWPMKHPVQCLLHLRFIPATAVAFSKLRASKIAKWLESGEKRETWNCVTIYVCPRVLGARAVWYLHQVTGTPPTL